MQKSCWYCHRPLSLFKSFKGELFCDAEHEKLYLSEQFKRVQDPFAKKPAPPKAEPEPAPEPVAASPVIEEVVEAGVEPVVELIIEPVVEPVVEPIVEPVVERAVEPVAERVIEEVAAPMQQAAPDPIPQTAPEPRVEQIARVEIPAVETDGEPPFAPLFAWPVNASEGILRKLVPDQTKDLVPQRANPMRAKLGELQIKLPEAGLVPTPMEARETAQGPPVAEAPIATISSAVLPRLGDQARLAEDFPTAASVATPGRESIRESRGSVPQIQPEQAIELIPGRVDPRMADRVQHEPGLSHGLPTRLPFRAGRPLPTGVPARIDASSGFATSDLSKHVPRLSFGSIPQPEATAALSSQLKPVAASGIDASLLCESPIAGTVALRTPRLLAFDIVRKLDWSPAPVPTSQIDPNANAAGFVSGVQAGTALSSQIAVRIPKAPAFQSAWKSSRAAPPAISFALSGMDQAGHSLNSPLETSLQLTLVSFATLGRTSLDGRALGRAPFVPADQFEPSQDRAASHTPESAIFSGPPTASLRSAGGFAAANLASRDSFAALAEIAAAAGVPASQRLSESTAVTRHVNGVEFAATLATSFGSRALQLQEPGLLLPLWGSTLNVTAAALPVVESTPISATALQLPQALSGTATIGTAAVRYGDPSVVNAVDDEALSALPQASRTVDSRRPGNLIQAAKAQIQTGTVAFLANSRDARVKVFEALTELRTLAQTSLPVSSTSLDPSVLTAGSTVAISYKEQAKDRVPDLSRVPNPLRLTPASLLGLPGAQPRGTALSPVQGDATEMLIALASATAESSVEAPQPIEFPAKRQTPAVHFSLESPGLPQHPAIFNRPAVQDHRRARRLAQSRARRHSPVALLAYPRVQDAKAPAQFAAEPEVPAVSLP